MRLHRLRLTAFGPFPDDIEIDFDALAADGLFLLHGQTGAGKSTVLDGVAFALFGRVPGARDINRRLHSDHAPAERVPEVELEATINGRRLRITRSPDHQRPKKRGDGTTTVKARGTLVWLDNSGPNLARLQEIGGVVTDLLGMSAEQFFQVVLLPQGEFARFLRATSEDRERLLERLFDTQRFGGVEDWFRERARTSANALTTQSAVVDNLIAQINLLGGAATADPDLDWAQDCLDEARATEARTRAESAAAAAAFDAARAAHTEGEKHTALRRRGCEAAERLEQLAAGAADLERAATALAGARRAAPIAPLLDDLDTATADLQKAEKVCTRAESTLSATDDGARLVADADDDAVDAAIAAWTAEVGRLGPLAERVTKRASIVGDLERISTEMTRGQQRVAVLESELADLPQRRTAATTALTQAQAARASLPQLATERRRLEKVSAALTSRTEVIEQLRAAEQGLLDARSADVAARETLVDLRERRLAGMAGELAGELADGVPCTVCGAVEHPAPAVSDIARVGEAQESAAAKAAQKAGEHHSRAAGTVATLTERRTNLDEIVGDATADQIGNEFVCVTDELAQATRSAERIPELEQALASIEEQAEAWRAERGRIDADQSGFRERQQTLTETLAALDADVSEATGGRIGVPERRAELTELCARAARMREARTELVRARRRRDDATERLAGSCTDAGFDDVAAVRAAIATSKRIAEWEKLIEQAATARAAAESTLAADDVAAVMRLEPVNMTELSAHLDATRRAGDHATKAYAVAADHARGLEECVTGFSAALDALAPVQARHAEINGLADLMAGRGQNSRRMSLHSYVLAARLEEVLVAASDRLRQMSSGRYEFVHSDASGPRGRRGGLEIEVRDEYTGAVRSTTTLSGGETFFASLALALGLSDVVAAESGGRVLDTMFIDEGFGTLDPEALDLVMGVLDELRTGGRVVGVVSHVDELRARIPAQLQVQRGENGSTIRLSVPVGAP
ncbi:SMC family ATPase [Gordonia sp. CPCC 205515]|uniref:AAA family ATPase n=1 Tax=Gordonia sp. CPCC 205515 TaxID=3140791 RepID=UPI003AF3B467